MLNCRAGFYLLVVSLGLVAATTSQTCLRRAPPYTDCSTSNDECVLLYDRSDWFAPPTQLPHPPSNTRTCYRTCFDESNQCRTFVSTVLEQPINAEEEGPLSSVRRIASPRFGEGNYRKSTNCRYSVKCAPGQLLSYSVHAFDLEENTTCSGEKKCVDWVEITYRSLGETRRFCGSGELGQVHIDGSEIDIEFVSNREHESGGFLYFITCITPKSDKNAVNLGFASPVDLGSNFNSNSFEDQIESNQCTPSSSNIERPLTLQPESELVDIIDPFAISRRVTMSGYISYHDNTIYLIDGLLEFFSGVFLLQVFNRFSSTPKSYYGSATREREFSGYGDLTISDGTAKFYQSGVNPIYQPTSEEARYIIQLEKAINSALGNSDSFDVADEYDLLEEESTGGPTKSTTAPTTVPITRVTKQPTLNPITVQPTEILHLQPVQLAPIRQSRRFSRQTKLRQTSFSDAQLAQTYGNSCNAVLRATACAYQRLVTGTDC